jgi:hemerythrin-like domain-containing protein
MSVNTKPDPLARFEAEHRHALRELSRLDQAATALATEWSPAHLETVREVHRFLTTEVRAHNENEERALFALLGPDAPIAVFEEEHLTLRGLERDLAAALDAGDRSRIPSIAHSIVDTLRGHIQREDEALFPMARAMLGPEGLDVVAHRLAD